MITFATMKEQDSNSPIIHLQQQQLLLRMEYEYEKEEFKRQTENMGIARKVKRGLCWYPATPGRSYYNSLNQLVIEITHTENTDIEHNFEFGRPVCFSASLPMENNLYELHRYRKLCRRDTDGSDNARSRCRYGSAGNGQPRRATLFRRNILSDHVRSLGRYVTLQRQPPGRIAGHIAGSLESRFPRALPRTVSLAELHAGDSCKQSAVCPRRGHCTWSSGNRKTTTLVEAIYETLHREPQVLVCAQSNTAVDWISEKLVDRGVNVLRIGNPTRVNDKMLSFTYERRFENHPLYPELWSIRKNLRELGSRARRGSYDEREGVRSRMSRLRDRATALEIQINSELFDGAHVIASTLVSSNHRLLNGRRFGTLFIDEAAQALEAACWIAIRKADRVVLAGDHCQLPPTIKCYEAARGGLERTLMEKVVSNKPAVVSLLKVQYRMHEEIMKFPSQWFYNGELEAAPEVRYRGILDWDTPIHWIDTSEMDFKEEFVGETFGRINKAEADLLLSELKIYINRISGNRILEEK